MLKRRKRIEYYQICNISYPILLKVKETPLEFKGKWLKALASIKEWRD